ncbi:MAG TPA: beta-L-arabinofuranosidase domain-containing protein [Mucilaginibacter sp.]|nr:beta-L-arabinofuranosidase domain-containing protein [Mucilaginibacter sp.]
MRTFAVLAILFSFICINSFAQGSQSANYVYGRAPLRQNPYIELPLGAIKPEGWLREMLVRQKDGATGNLDKLYPSVMGKRNGWLGGDGDQWERGPYWIDGLLPLAYILNDKELIAKVKPWIEWTLKSQQPDGYFGPAKDYSPEPGIQRDNSHDWWPKIVMLKVLMQYYSATGDKRVINLLTNYFKYQLRELPAHPLDHWSFWARYRGGDNLMVVYWLYNITGDKFLLDLAELLHKQTFDYTGEFLNTDLLTRNGSIHGVNLGEGMKEPIIYYQQHTEKKYLEATEKSYADLRKYNGMANGMFGGDESLHGNNPTQGSELCTAVEEMFTLENTLAITGDVNYADHLERIAFNALPAQVDENLTDRQYFQQANQVMVTQADRNFDINHSGTDVCYGLQTGYACCTSNMHQGWPKFTQNLWYATPDKGIAALVYSPSEAKISVANGTVVNIKEETNYPFSGTIKFTLNTNSKSPVAFPFDLRIPEWCKKAIIKVNGKVEQEPEGDRIVKLSHEWKSGDMVELELPMHIRQNRWYENSVSVERGPLVYALKIGQEIKKVNNPKDTINYGSTFYEVRPTTPWNFGLISTSKDKLDEQFKVEDSGKVANYPWTLDAAPIIIKTTGKEIPSWKLYGDMAGPLPYSNIYNENEPVQPDQQIILVPYGCTKLRISEFPVVNK